MRYIRAGLNFLWLDSFTVAHGIATTVLLLLLGAIASPSPVPALLLAGLISTQVCLATAWSTWSPEWIHVRSGRLLWQMAWFYLLLLVFDSFSDRRHTVMLWALPLTMVLFFLGTWLPSAILRWFGWRREKAGEPPSGTIRFQFRLADVLRWTTLLCLLLAVMVRFRDEVEGWGGLGYAIMFYFGVVTSVPIGLTVSILFWLSLGKRWTTARSVIAGLLVGVGAIISTLAVYFASELNRSDNGLWLGIWVLAVVVCSVTLVTAAVLRAVGWRVTRIASVRVDKADDLV